MTRFEWDPVKAKTNYRKHGVAFEDAIYVFDDPYALFEHDRVDESGETRWQALGAVGDVAVLLVAHTVREDEEVVRLISARLATKNERKRYEEARAHNAD
jgi:uncharacterized DUF497 family protein